MKTNWKQIVAQRLPWYGHRNWIVMADSAYPAQSGVGIETIVTGAGQLEVVGAVMKAVARQTHVRPVVMLDAELESVPEADAPGVDAYRTKLHKLLGAAPVKAMPHEEIIVQLDQAAKLFHVLILKTKLTIPYTSVFVQLDCQYWSPQAEQRLRKSLA